MTDWLNRCHFGDVRDVLRRMIADGVKVQTIVTSPPYWGLRSYLPPGHPDKGREIGSEPTLWEFIETMTGVMMLAREVLADDGTMWMNMGDCYATGAGKVNTAPGGGTQGERWAGVRGDDKLPGIGPIQQPNRMPQPGLKPKDLAGQPWRLAFALQDAGWWLRQDIIWSKPNPMPESTRDRCTKAHEYIFLMSKGVWSGAAEPIQCSNVDAAWLAALIDGEGTIGIGATSGGGFQGHIHIANTCRALLERAVAVTGMGGITDSGKGVNWPVYRWQVSGPKAAAVLYRIRTFLIAKQRQADNLLEFQETVRRYGGTKKPADVTEKQRGFWLRGKALNKGAPLVVDPNRAHWDGGTYYYDFDAVQEPVNGGAHARRSAEALGLKRPGFGHGYDEAAKPRYKTPDGCNTGPGAHGNFHPKGREKGKVLPPKADLATSGNDGAYQDGKSERMGRGAGWRERKLAESDERIVKNNDSMDEVLEEMRDTRNRRSVWTVASQPYKGAHFATFPTKLIEHCILAGAPPKGIVLDLFMGSGTTAQVAEQLGRQWIGIDIDERNKALQDERLRQPSLSLEAA